MLLRSRVRSSCTDPSIGAAKIPCDQALRTGHPARCSGAIHPESKLSQTRHSSGADADGDHSSRNHPSDYRDSEGEENKCEFDATKSESNDSRSESGESSNDTKSEVDDA